ncbi:hypothetical protein C9F11_08890 [Streptomyces sp. YIM 121038]|uniref:hypothetical protein n=1 Tax=Streptomyces sp. YIM 121038 TaxID=2136401 RepID=UPI001110F016|nr:hypothetical protein [Streptomyces sp. YIM 121038]QCX75467.1 hypothetical protein C9F11_08890 [Streptomyces sp. YIM 121038]
MAVATLPEAATYRALLKAIAVIRTEIQLHEEELTGVNQRTKRTAEGAQKAADAMANAVDPDGGKIDDMTLAEVREIAAAAQGASAACGTYVAAAKDASASADACEQAARTRNEGYQAAVDASPVSAPNRGFLASR